MIQLFGMIAAARLEAALERDRFNALPQAEREAIIAEREAARKERLAEEQRIREVKYQENWYKAEANRLGIPWKSYRKRLKRERHVQP